MSWFSSGAFEKKDCIPSEIWSTGRNANASIIQQKCLTSLLSRYDCARPKSWIFLHLCFKHPRTSTWGPRTFATAFITASSKSVMTVCGSALTVRSSHCSTTTRKSFSYRSWLLPRTTKKHLTITTFRPFIEEVQRISHLPLVCWQSTIIIHCSSFRLFLHSSCT